MHSFRDANGRDWEVDIKNEGTAKLVLRKMRPFDRIFNLDTFRDIAWQLCRIQAAHRGITASRFRDSIVGEVVISNGIKALAGELANYIVGAWWLEPLKTDPVAFANNLAEIGRAARRAGLITEGH